MLSFFLTVLKLLRTAFNAASDSEFRALAFITFALLLTGSVFYARVEGWGIIDALYFCVMTMTTIGYGDLTPANNLYKMFAVVYAFLSIGVFVSLVAKLAWRCGNDTPPTTTALMGTIRGRRGYRDLHVVSRV